MSKPSIAPIDIPYLFSARPYQQQVMDAMDQGCKRIIWRACRRAGKDKTCINIMIKEMFKRVGSYYYFFPEFSQGRKAIWEGMDKASMPLLQHIPREWIKSKNNNEMKIELHNGSIFRIIGTDKFDSIMGTNPLGCVFSEYALQNSQAFDYIRPILNENNGWALLQGTPRGQNHMFKLEMKNKDNPEWRIFEVQCLWPDLPNYYPVVNNNQADTSRRINEDRDSGMTEETIEQEYGVSYVAGQRGAYYMDCIADARKQGRIGNFPHNNYLYTDIFSDLGIADDTVMWFRQVDGSRLVWVNYYENNTKDLAHYVDRLVELKAQGYKFRTWYIPHDGGHRSRQTGLTDKDLLIRLLREAGLNVNVVVAQKPATKQVPINLTRSRFSRYFFDATNCNKGLEHISLFHRQWDKQNQCFRDYPAKDGNDHASDALAIDGMTGHMNEDYGNMTPQRIVTDFDPVIYTPDDDFLF